MSVKYIVGNSELLPELKELKIELLKHHRNLDHCFQSDFDKMIEKIKNDFINNKNESNIKVAIAKDADTEKVIGYCYGEIYNNKSGELVSLYVEPRYQKQKVGHILTNYLMQWFKEESVEEIFLYVCKGNEAVYKFYEKFGFYPRKMLLKNISSK